MRPGAALGASAVWALGGLALAAPPVQIDAQQIVANDGAAFAAFGKSVAFDGSTIVVGAYRATAGAPRSGAAYIFGDVGGVWTQRAKLTASDGGADHELGTSVAVDGDTVVVGAPASTGSTNAAGAAYVFVRSGSTWTEQAKLVPGDSAADDQFGNCVAVEGDTVVVGRPLGAAVGSGSAYVFTRSGTSWTERATLAPSTPSTGDRYGARCAISGDSIAVRSLRRVEVWIGSGASWSRQTSLTVPEATHNSFDFVSVDLDGDTLIAGGYDGSGLDSGRATVFKRSGTTWSTEATLLPAAPQVEDGFGSAVAVHGDLAMVGAVYNYVPRAHAFVRDGSSWSPGVALVEAWPSGLPGSSVATFDGTVVVGDPGTTTPASNAGSAGIYRLRRALGDPCGAAGDCASGFCSDGVCCDTPCSGLCEACTAAVRGAGADGECGPIALGIDPGDECDVEDPSTCGRTGECDGTGQCAIYSPGVVCAPASCVAADVEQPESTCNGAGSCIAPPTVSCDAANTCVNGACTVSCGTDSDCASTHFCAGGFCVPDLSEGQPCSAPDQCASGSCVDGACCESACGGGCGTCSSTPGVCTPVPAGRPGDPSCTPFVCDGASVECPTACTDDADCAAQGASCTSAGDCVQTAECDGSVAISATGKRTDCAPFSCRAGGCLTSCSTSADCISGSLCDPELGECVIQRSGDSDGGDDGGCGCRVVGEGRGERGGGLLLLAATLVMARRRRSRWATPAGILAAVGCSTPEAETTAHDRVAQPVVWVESSQVTTASPGDMYGVDVSLNGSAFVVGTRHQPGIAYAYSFDASSWTETAILQPADSATQDRFGEHVAIDGDNVVISARGHDGDGTNAGAVYVYGRAGATWQYQETLTGGAAQTALGSLVALNGDTIAAGTDAGGGSVRVFTRAGATWSVQANLSAGGVVGAGFGSGRRLDVSGDTLAMGEPQDASAGTNTGAVDVFERSGTMWSPPQRLLASDPAAFRRFGESVDVSSDLMIVGGSSAAYVFRKIGSAWTEEAKLTPADPNTSDFGRDVAIDADFAMVGAPGDSTRVVNGGALYVFERVSTSWQQVAKIAPAALKEGDKFGSSVAFEANAMVVGKPGAFNAPDTESVYLFRLKQEEGAVCTDAIECASGFCIDGVCCDGGCDGLCVACSVAIKGGGVDGRCGPIASGTDPEDECAAQPASTCGTLGVCDGAGACERFSPGAVCEPSSCVSPTSQTDPGLCDATGACIAGGTTACLPGYLCVNGSCATNCAADDNCAADHFCRGAACVPDGALGDQCLLDDHCTSGFCVDGVCCDGACDGACATCTAGDGRCAPAVAGALGEPSCAPLLCNGDSTDCPSSCANDEDCANGVCDLDSGSCIVATSCDDATTVRTGTGDLVSCEPFACEGGRCLTTCESSAQCSAGFSCDDALCVRAATGSVDDGGGCGCRVAAHPRRLSVAGVGLLVLMAGRLWRRPRARRRGAAARR